MSDLSQQGGAKQTLITPPSRNCMNTRLSHGRGRSSSCAGTMCSSSSMIKAAATRSIAAARRAAAQSVAADCTTAVTTSGCAAAIKTPALSFRGEVEGSSQGWEEPCERGGQKKSNFTRE